MKIRDDIKPPEIFVVLMHARQCDIAKFAALTGFHDREQIAQAVTPRFGIGMMGFCTDDGDLVAVGGATQDRANVVRTGFVATDRWEEIAAPLSRWVKRHYFPALRAAGVHRIETITTLDHPDTERWLRWLGLEPEQIKPGYGATGAAFVEYAWVSDAFAARAC